MNVKALLDIDLVALESTEKVTMMLDMTAPITDAAMSRPGQAVEVVLDRSGSMSGPVFNSAKESILKLIDRLAPQDSFGLIAFDNQALIVAPIRTMADHDMPALRKQFVKCTQAEIQISPSDTPWVFASSHVLQLMQAPPCC